VASAAGQWLENEMMKRPYVLLNDRMLWEKYPYVAERSPIG
jgi:hypothetical protein